MNKILYKSNKESGQIIILLAVSLLVLLGVAALAVDGGMLYTERRFAQNAADASSLAGASSVANEMVKNDVFDSNFSCSMFASTQITKSTSSYQGMTYEEIGLEETITRASTNNFILQEVANVSENNGVIILCNDEAPNGKYLDFYVTITTETPTSFLHLISSNFLFSTVQAVTRLYPMHDLGYGNAIVALNTECSNPQDGLTFSGTNEINITGGGIWSNNCIRMNGPANDQSPLEINLIDAIEGDDYIPAANLLDPEGVNIINGILTPPDENIWEPEDALDLLEEANEIKEELEKECDFDGEFDEIIVDETDKNIKEIQPGTYESLSITDSKDILTFTNPDNVAPIYCFANGITINGGTVTGDPVTIYNKSGDISISATAEVTLIAPFADPGEVFSIINGILIFMDPLSDDAVELAGDGTSYFAGTIFNLNGDVKISGNPSVGPTDPDDPEAPDVQEFATQIIAKNVDLSGNVAINISFDLSNTSIVDSKLFLLR